MRSHVLRSVPIDVPNRRMYFEKNETFGHHLTVNCSGIDLQFAHGEPHLLIHQVFEDSPAAEAGIMENDELIAINDRPVSTLALPAIQKMLRQEGETVKLKILQGGNEKEVELKLRSLLE